MVEVHGSAPVASSAADSPAPALVEGCRAAAAAVRAGAAHARRSAIQQRIGTKGLHCALRCLSATDRRNALLQTRAAMSAHLAGSPRSVHWSGAISVE